MDLELIFNNMSEEEKKVYFKNDTVEYYKYIKTTPRFMEIEDKISNKGKLEDEEWNFILEKLFLVFVHSLEEENRVNIMGKLIIQLSKLNTKIFKYGTPLYNMTYKFIQLISSYEKEAIINDDLYEGFFITNTTKNEENLEYLLNQYKAANRFRESKNAFQHEYHKGETSELSNNELLYIHAFNQAYEEEKKLVKKHFTIK